MTLYNHTTLRSSQQRSKDIDVWLRPTLSKQILLNNNHSLSFCLFLPLFGQHYHHPHTPVSISQALLMQGQESVTLVSHTVSGPNDVLGSSAATHWLMSIPFAWVPRERITWALWHHPATNEETPAAPESTRAPADPLTETHKPVQQFCFPHEGYHSTKRKTCWKFSARSHLGVHSAAYLGQSLQPDQER